jgi:hypothetical protein
MISAARSENILSERILDIIVLFITDKGGPAIDARPYDTAFKCYTGAINYWVPILVQTKHDYFSSEFRR